MAFVYEHFFQHAGRRRFTAPVPPTRRSLTHRWSHEQLIDAATFLLSWAFVLGVLIAVEVGGLYFMSLFH